VGALVNARLLRVATALDLLVRRQLAGRSRVVSVVVCLLAARGLVDAYGRDG